MVVSLVTVKIEIVFRLYRATVVFQFVMVYNLQVMGVITLVVKSNHLFGLSVSTADELHTLGLGRGLLISVHYFFTILYTACYSVEDVLIDTPIFFHESRIVVVWIVVLGKFLVVHTLFTYALDEFALFVVVVALFHDVASVSLGFVEAEHQFSVGNIE